MSFRISTTYPLLLALVLAPPAARATDPAYDSGGSGEATRHLNDAYRAAYHGRYSEAIDDINQALTLLPSYGDAFESRAEIYKDIGRYAEAASDLNRVIAMRPNDMSLAMERVDLDLLRSDGATGLANLKSAMKLPLHSTQRDPQEAGTYESGTSHYYITGHMESYAVMYGSIAEQLLHQDDAALSDMDRMLQLESEHPEYILANYCNLAGRAGLLEEAELACQSAIDHNSHDIGQYDSLGYVHLRMKQWDKAIADYNKALYGRLDLSISLYGRGIARRARGDSAGGNADIDAATRIEPDIANIMKRLGVPVI
jgi:tetratricopeptide (TPR) repeat protein